MQTAVLQHILRRNGLLEENPLDLTSCSETPENVVRRFPLFTGRPATAPASALGEAFCPHDSVNELDLPKRAAGGLRDFGLRTIGELLCTQNLALKKSGNFGEGSLLTVQQAVLQHILRRNGLLEEKPLDLTSWQGLVQDLLTRCIRNDHERAALADKRGLLTNKPRTLKAIGQQRGFTRERVRQLVLTACRHLQSNQARRLVAPFLTLVKDLVAEARGRRPCDALAADVATRLSWSVAPSGFALAGLLDPLTGGEAWARGYVTADSLRRSCPVVRGVLSGLVLDRVEVSPREASPGGTAFLEPPSAAIVTGRQAELKRQSLRGRDPKRRSQQVTSGQLHHERGQLLRPELSRQQAAFAERCRVMKALAHEKRLAILYLLQGGPRFFAELAAATELSGQQLDNHLHVLRLLQLLTVRREEGCKKYGLNPGKAKMLAGIIGENA